MVFNLNSTKQWSASLINGAITDYDLEVFPGNIGNGIDVTGVYNTSTGDLRYLLKDGNMYDASGVVLANNSYPSLGFSIFSDLHFLGDLSGAFALCLCCQNTRETPYL